VPRHHHLWGASRGDYLRFEAANSALLARVHRLALGTEAPIPRIVTINRIESIPGPVQLLAHFDDPSRRESLQAALACVERSDLVTPPQFPARRFLEATTPSQAILVGTTSFRLERLIAYWRDAFDWRKAEEELNRFPHFRAEIPGANGERHTIHFDRSGN